MSALAAEARSAPPARQPRLGLRARLALLVVATLGPLAAFQFNELHHERRQLVEAAMARVQDFARNGAERYRDGIDDARSTLDLLSNVPDVVSSTADTCQRFLSSVQRSRSWASAMFRVDGAGRITCSTVEAAVGLDVSKRDWYLKTVGAGHFTVSDFYITLARKLPTIAAALPLAPVAGAPATVLMANLDLGWFDGLAETIGRTQKATVLLVDGAGRGLSRYPAIDGLSGRNLSGSDMVGAALMNDEGQFQGKDLDGQEHLFGYRRLPGTDARLLISLDRKAVLAPIDAAILRAGLLLTLLVAVLGSVIWLAGRRIFVAPLVEAGQALRKSEAFLRGIVDGSGDCIKVLDRHGNLEFISRNGQCLMEIDDPASVIGASFVGLFPPDMQIDIQAKLDSARAGGTVRFDAAIFTAKGTPLHVDVLVTSLPMTEGQPERLVAIARDITSLKDAEGSAQEAGILFRGLFDHSPNCLTVHQVLADGSFRIETWNPEAARVMGPSSADVQGKPVEDVLPPEPAAAIRADLEAVVRGREIVRREGVQILEDGSERIWEITHVPLIDDATGRLTRILGAGHDVTHLRQIERAVTESEARYRMLADNSTDMVTHMDVTGQRLFVSPGSRDLLGYEPHELVGTSPQQMLHPDDAPGLAAVFDDLRSGRLDRAVNVNRLRHRTGGWIWVEASLRVVRDGDNRATGFVASIRSIMERRQADDALRQSEARYRMLAETTSDVIARLDLSFRTDYISPSCRAMIGHEPDELIGTDATHVMHPDDVVGMRELARRLSTGGLDGDRDTITYRMRHKDGRWMWVENRVGLLRDEATGHPQGLVCSIRDVSEGQRQAEELRAAKESAELARAQADAASQAKTDFLATMSHEIRTPLNAIIGFTGLIMDKGDELAPDIYRQVELVQSSGAALLTVVNDILDFSKVEAGAIELDKRPFPLGALIDNCLSIMRGTLRGTAVSVRANLDAALPRGVIGDEARLRQILLNLLNNAGKFTREGYVALAVRHEASSAKGERLRFSISDTGIGIPKEKQARLFERFSQTDSSIKRDFGGTGLGLAICKRLVELMDGEIGVFSDEGQGATFWFTVTLPRGRLELASVTAEDSGKAHKTGYLLLVEDLEINQILAKAVLEARGHTVDIVSDGAAAVMAVQDKAYDLVLMDVQMPGMDGMSATQIIRRMAKPGPRLPIIAMTANVLPEQIRGFREAGMDDHVGKPFQRLELYATIDQWLPDRRTALGDGVGQAMVQARA